VTPFWIISPAKEQWLQAALAVYVPG
jgi:hypothetical protein